MKQCFAILTAMMVLTAATAVAQQQNIPEEQEQAQTAKQENQEENELDVTADRMEILLDGKTIELTDNVRFEDETMVLTASRMKIFLEEDQDKQKKRDEQKTQPRQEEGDHEDMKLKRIEADGNVVLRKKEDATESVMGDKAVYEVKTDTVTLTGNCVVTQGGHVMKGKLVTFDRLKQKINVRQAVITIKLPKGKNKGKGLDGFIKSSHDN